MAKKSKLKDTEREAVVLAMLRREEPVTVLARRYGVSENTLYTWRDKFLEGGRAALANGKGQGGESRRAQALERELAERDRVIGELTIANRILKKTANGLY